VVGRFIPTPSIVAGNKFSQSSKENSDNVAVDFSDVEERMANKFLSPEKKKKLKKERKKKKPLKKIEGFTAPRFPYEEVEGKINGTLFTLIKCAEKGKIPNASACSAPNAEYWMSRLVHITKMRIDELEGIQECMSNMIDVDFDYNRNLYYEYIEDIIDKYIEEE
jgi:hypothetical protein